jgi:hypothetical protein
MWTTPGNCPIFRCMWKVCKLHQVLYAFWPTNFTLKDETSTALLCQTLDNQPDGQVCSTFLEPLRTWGGRTISTCRGEMSRHHKNCNSLVSTGLQHCTRDRLSRRVFHLSRAHRPNVWWVGLCSKPNYGCFILCLSTRNVASAENNSQFIQLNNRQKMAIAFIWSLKAKNETSTSICAVTRIQFQQTSMHVQTYM